jgi:histone deacetylase 1/2
VVLEQLSKLQPAPSVGLHDVPRESIGEHLGFWAERAEMAGDRKGGDDLDKRLAREWINSFCMQFLLKNV